MPSIKIQNGTILDPSQNLERKGDLYIRDGRIVDLAALAERHAGDVEVVARVVRAEALDPQVGAGPLDPFNHAVSFTIECEDQSEVDRLWNALSEGGTIERCGWLKDRYGVSRQIVPSKIIEMMSDEDRTRAKHVAEAMLQMVKFDIAALERAFDG